MKPSELDNWFSRSSTVKKTSSVFYMTNYEYEVKLMEFQPGEVGKYGTIIAPGVFYIMNMR